MTFEKGDRVIVTQFIRNRDDADTQDLDGWVVFYGEAVIIIASTPDWATLPEDDYFTATFPLDEVIVSPFTPEPAEQGAANVLFVLLITGAALVVVGVLGHWVWPIIIAGAWLVAAVFIIALFMGAKQGENDGR